MKKSKMIMSAIFACTILFLTHSLKAQDSNDKIYQDSKEAKAAFIKSDDAMQSLFANSYGYVIFPNVGKGAVVVGGASGNGVVYKKGKKIGTAKMTQVNVGAQVGGKSYREIIFFEDKAAFDRFTDSKFEFDGQVSAVAVKSGASANAKYTNGVQVYTQEKSGLMAEASLGGQKFSYKSL